MKSICKSPQTIPQLPWVLKTFSVFCNNLIKNIYNFGMALKNKIMVILPLYCSIRFMCAREVGKATTQSASFHSFDCLLVHKPPNEKWHHNRSARESMICEFYIQPEYIVGNVVYFPFLGAHCVRDTIPRNRNKPRLLFPVAWFKHKTTRQAKVCSG